MSRILVVYESKYGQSAKIAEHAGAFARERGHDAAVVHVDRAGELAIEDHDAYVVVAPIYNQRHTANITRFVRANTRTLSSRPSALLSVSASAASRRDVVRTEAELIAWRYVRALGWATLNVAAVGGALAYPRYGAVVGFVMRLLARRNGLATDTSRIHELTEWPTVDRALGAVLRYAAGSSARSAAASSDRSIHG